MNKPQPISEISNLALQHAVPALGRITGFSDEGFPLVELDGHTKTAKMVTRLAGIPRDELINQQVLVVFEHHDRDLPVAIDLIHQPDSDPWLMEPPTSADTSEVCVTGETVFIKAEQHLELRVGKASIIIDQNGKITTRSKTQLNRASGPIRIKGGHVDIN